MMQRSGDGSADAATCCVSEQVPAPAARLWSSSTPRHHSRLRRSSKALRSGNADHLIQEIGSSAVDHPPPRSPISVALAPGAGLQAQGRLLVAQGGRLAGDHRVIGDGAGAIFIERDLHRLPRQATASSCAAACCCRMRKVDELVLDLLEGGEHGLAIGGDALVVGCARGLDPAVRAPPSNSVWLADAPRDQTGWRSGSAMSTGLPTKPYSADRLTSG